MFQDFSVLDRYIHDWADNVLLDIELELSSPKPSDTAFMVRSINNILKYSAQTQREYPLSDGHSIITYRNGDTWKYTFTAPLMITKRAAETVYSGIKSRDKAKKHIPHYKNPQTLIILGEHACPTKEQRRLMPKILIEKEDTGQLDFSRFPNTAYAREILIKNIIVLMHVSENDGLPVSELINECDHWSRYHSTPNHSGIAPHVIQRKWFAPASFDGKPELLDRIVAQIRKNHQPATFEEFWDHLVIKLS